MKNVADDGDIQSFDVTFVFANRHSIKQRLCWMFMRAVAGVDDGSIAHFCELIRRPRHRMTNDNAIRGHRLEIARGIEKVSPFETLEEETLIFIASAERRLAAISKEVRVRVEDSKKRLMIVRPRRAGTFLISRLETSRKVSAVSSK